MSVLKKVTIAVLSATVVFTSAGLALAEGKGGRGGKVNFETMDTNSDSKIDFAEFQAPLIERFNEFDANDDGIVTQAEIEENAEGRRVKRMAKRIAHRFDVDGNEEVTLAEMENRQTKMFALLDVNDDGFVAEDEMPKRGKHRGGKKGGKRGGDRN